MNIEKVYKLQDEILEILSSLGKDNFLFSGGTLLSRGYLSHRDTDNIEIFVPEDTDLNALLEDIKKIFRGKYILSGLSIKREYTFPKNVDCISFSIKDLTDIKGNNQVNIEICPDIFWEDFERFKLENSLLISDIEEILFKMLIKFINNPKDVLTIFDIASIDNELHLIDFVDIFEEKMLSKGFSVYKDIVIEKLKEAKEYIQENLLENEKILKKYGITYKPEVLIRWIDAKIQELS